jgi:hypothetical protein
VQSVVSQRIWRTNLAAEHIADIAGVDTPGRGIGGDGIDQLTLALWIIDLLTGTELRGRDWICPLRALCGGIDERLQWTCHIRPITA